MIKTAGEFIKLCSSNDLDDCEKSLSAEAPLNVWADIVENHPSNLIDVAQNRTIPDEIMLKLIESGNEYVRAILAQKRRLKVSLFPVLAIDSNETVRKAVAANAKTPIEIVQDLMSDSVEDVAKVATYNFQLRSSKKFK
jgi:hypothetical protein